MSGSAATLSNLFVDNAITASAIVVTGDITANRLTTNIVSQSILFTSGSNKFGDEQSDVHLFTGSVNISGSITGNSFVGDGSGLTNVTTTVVENATVSDTFSSVTSKEVVHNFGTKDVIVSTYNDNDQLIFPASITTTTGNKVDIVFDRSSTGRVVVAKGGHLASGSAVLSGTGVFSGSAQIDHDATTNFVANEHIDHSSITIGSGKGLFGGGTIDTNRSLSINTGSDHFKDGITAATRYEETVTGNTSYTLTHNLNEDYPIVQVYDTNKLQVIPALISASSSNAVQVGFDFNFEGKVIIKK